MYHYHFHQWLSFFYFYCLFGWCFESTYVSLKSHKFINRGFMKGPWLPLYGSGAICVLFITLPFQQDWRLVYLIGALAATLLEYVVGTAMVSLFKVRYWDYSNRKIQLHGHICLSSTIAWGFLSLLMVYVVHEPVADFILSLNNDLVMAITFFITVFMVYDFANAFRQAMDLRALIIQAEKICLELGDRLELQKDLLKSNMEERMTIMNSRIDYIQKYWNDQLEDKKNEMQTALNEQLMQTEEQLANFEWMIEKEIYDLKIRMEKIREHMLLPASRPLLQNPGAKFTTLKKETKILKDRLKRK